MIFFKKITIKYNSKNLTAKQFREGLQSYKLCLSLSLSYRVSSRNWKAQSIRRGQGKEKGPLTRRWRRHRQRPASGGTPRCLPPRTGSPAPPTKYTRSALISQSQIWGINRRERGRGKDRGILTDTTDGAGLAAESRCRSRTRCLSIAFSIAPSRPFSFSRLRQAEKPLPFVSRCTDAARALAGGWVGGGICSGEDDAAAQMYDCSYCPLLYCSNSVQHRSRIQAGRGWSEAGGPWRDLLMLSPQAGGSGVGSWSRSPRRYPVFANSWDFAEIR
jgi:hypothetical protein